jgi:hypothetical protein
VGDTEKMRQTKYFVILLLLINSVIALSQHPAAKIGPSAVWPLPPHFVTTAHNACDQSSSEYATCMITQMEKAGAPADAVRFSRELCKVSHGGFGIMTGFQDEGPVAFAWISYPLRANTNYGLLLVNGKPRMINVEDPKLLDAKAMKRSPQFQDLKAQFPKIDLWPGDRDGKLWPNSQVGPDGEIQFTVSYPLRNGCHACARAGDAIFNWNFDASGKFLGTSFQGLIDPPLQ